MTWYNPTNIERGGCKHENLEGKKYQCLCDYSGFTTYRVLILTISVILFLLSVYFFLKVWKLRKLSEKMKASLKLRVVALSLCIFGTADLIVFYSFDPHRCNEKAPIILESLLYGMPISTSCILLIFIVIRWMDLLKITFVSHKHILFSPKLSRFLVRFCTGLFLYEIICRIFWIQVIYIIYSVVAAIITLVLFFGFMVTGSRLTKKLISGSKLLSKEDKKRKTQIKLINRTAFFGSSISLLILIESIVIMPTTCWRKMGCTFAIEFIMRSEILLIFSLYLFLSWKSNQKTKTSSNNNNKQETNNQNTKENYRHTTSSSSERSNNPESLSPDNYQMNEIGN
ncbi:hypothetical protein M0812_10833 [Anaeramoeba flamelloides]|uniref:Uncharacterized protein n=1 Tax=Anaeramoeba flamelloides TaxID=1746091 RepID=A0AAV7ZYD9_9EUKA|nr:hypothetical protein M0812_10833 [Anaeramoeba flamelloides]